MRKSADAASKTGWSRYRFWPILVALIVAESASAFETAMVYVAIPELMAEYQADAATAGWLVTAFFLTGAVSAGICGRLGDLYGRRRLIVILLVASGAGSLISLLGDSIEMVIAGRTIQGLAGAVLPLVIALTREVAPAGRANFAIGAVASTAVVAASVGSFASGVLIDQFSWHAIFVFSALLAGLGAIGLQVVVPAGTRAQRRVGERLDWAGALLLGAALATALYGVTNGGKRGWDDATVLGCIAIGISLFVVFVLLELRLNYPLIQPRLFVQRHLALTLLATVFMGGLMGGLGTVVAIVQQAPVEMPLGLGLSATEAGMLTGGAALFAYLLTPVLGRVSRAYGGRATLLVGAILGLAWMGTFALMFETLGGFVVVSLIGAVATLFVYGSLPILVAESVEEGRTGEVAGAQVVMRMTMTTVASAVTSTVLASSTVAGTTLPDVTGMNRALFVVALWTAPLVIVALLLRRKNIDEGQGQANLDPVSAASVREPGTESANRAPVVKVAEPGVIGATAVQPTSDPA